MFKVSKNIWVTSSYPYHHFLYHISNLSNPSFKSTFTSNHNTLKNKTHILNKKIWSKGGIKEGWRQQINGDNTARVSSWDWAAGGAPLYWKSRTRFFAREVHALAIFVRIACTPPSLVGCSFSLLLPGHASSIGHFAYPSYLQATPPMVKQPLKCLEDTLNIAVGDALIDIRFLCFKFIIKFHSVQNNSHLRFIG